MIKPLIRKVVVAVNGSEASVHAAMYGILMAKLYHFNLKFVYVVDTATLKRLTLSKFLVEDENISFKESLRDDGKKYLYYVMGLAREKGVEAESELLEGSVLGEIVRAADKFNAQLILLGGSPKAIQSNYAESHKSGAFSTTDKEIIMNASCSVMVVREPKIEQLFRIA